MNITLNSESKTITPDSNLADLISGLSLNREGVAVAVNQVVVNCAKWSEWTLKDGDSVDIFNVVAGG